MLNLRQAEYFKMIGDHESGLAILDTVGHIPSHFVAALCETICYLH